jgi:hypothetical protein
MTIPTIYEGEQMKKIKLLCLSLALGTLLSSPRAEAMGKPAPGNGGGTQVNPAMENFLLNLGIFYAKQNKKIGPILTALNINTAEDLRKLISGEANGSNIQDIITNAIFQKAFKDPKYAAWFAQLGVTDFASLKKLLSNSNGATTDLLVNFAFNYIQSNPNYSVWLSTMGINSPQDLKDMLTGGGEKIDIKTVILTFAMMYAQENPKYAPYIFLLSALLSQNSSAGPVDIENPALGAYTGLGAAEITKIQTTKKKNK